MNRYIFFVNYFKLSKFIKSRQLVAGMLMVLFLSFIFSAVAFADWDGQVYAPGATLNPDCAPGIANCTVSLVLNGDVTGTASTTVVGNDSHSHTGETIFDLSAANFATSTISQWTNDSGYITDGNTNWNNEYGFITGLNFSQLTNGAGIYLDYRPNNTACAANQVLKYAEGTGWVCANDTDTNTTYTASGNGLELSGTQFALELDGSTLSVGPNGLKIADNYDDNFLTSYTETDPVFIASPAFGIATTSISNWNTAYSWGDHSAAGYLTSTALTPYSTKAVADGLYLGIGATAANSNLLENHNAAYFQIAGSYLTPTSSLDPSNVNQTATYRFVSDAEKSTWNGKQAGNANLTSLSGLSYSSGAPFIKMTGANTFAFDNSTYLTVEADPIFAASPAYGIASSSISNWNTAFGWGDHSAAGYLTSTALTPYSTKAVADGLYLGIGATAANSSALNGHADTYFYQASNPNSYISSLSGALLADGTVTGATTQAQTFTNGITVNGVISVGGGLQEI